jgi:hypothetical protein
MPDDWLKRIGDWRKRRIIAKLKAALNDPDLLEKEVEEARITVVNRFSEQLESGVAKLAEPKLAEPGHRYTGAWGEVSQRIAQRQSLVYFYSTVGGAILSFAFVQPDGRSLAYAIGPLSLAFSLLLAMHERQIAVLRSFMARIESLDDRTPPGNLHYPKFHQKNHSRSTEGHEIRKLHDMVAGGLVVGYGIIAGHSFWRFIAKGDPSRVGLIDWILFTIALILWAIGLGFIVENHTTRRRIFESLHDKD